MSESGQQWALDKVDSAARAIVLEQVATGTLEIYQSESHSPDKVLLGSFEVSCKLPIPAEQTAPPWSLAWNTPKPALQGTVNIDCAKDVKLGELKRNLSATHTVRTCGGQDHDKQNPRATHVRGGYLFARADMEDGELATGKGVRKASEILCIKLAFNNGKTTHGLFLLYPKEPRQAWIYDEHSFELSFSLKIGERNWSADGPTITSPAHEFTLDATKTEVQLKKDLTKEYGNPAASPALHARDFSPYFAESSAVGAAFRGHLATAVQYVNGKIPAGDHFRLDPVEVGTLMLSEGGVNVIKTAVDSKTSPSKLVFSGYNDLGIDSFVTRYRRNEGSLRDFTPPSLQSHIKKGNLRDETNERSDRWTTFDVLGFENAVAAVTALYGHAKQAFARDVADASVMGVWAVLASDLPLHVQHYWGTVYFNCGPETGKRLLRTHGVEWHDVPWDKEDDHYTYCTQAKFNVSWRLASYRLLRSKVTIAPAAEPAAAPATEPPTAAAAGAPAAVPAAASAAVPTP